MLSIHALLAESDRPGLTRYYPGRNFYPRSPCGERPPCPRCSRGTLPISIHALLAESDRPTTSCTAAHKHFYPRSPCGERHVQEALAVLAMEFLSTLSLRRATDVRRATGTAGSLISIHALLAESDVAPPYNLMINQKFLSTLSLRRATLNCSRNGLAIR